ncbi:MAG TPA: PEGA domain-containing protein, partial [Thermotogota bacterium]|nr:PEGA domain-containing protein [Thermotogota bacterium]
HASSQSLSIPYPGPQQPLAVHSSLQKGKVTLLVHSDPEDSKVFVDGVNIPGGSVELDKGTFLVRVERQHYQPQQRELELTADDLFSRKELFFSLEKTCQDVSLSSTPVGVEVWVEGQSLGKTPLSLSLPWGSYRLEGKTTGYDSVQTLLEISPEDVHQPQQIQWDMRKKPIQWSFDSSPSGAQVWIDGKNVGTTPFSHTVYDGTFRVEMRKDRYESQTRSFEFDLWDLGDSKKTTFTLSPRPASLVLLPYLGDKSVTLADVRVRVNGEEVTRSPLSLEPGTYTLVAEKAEYISQTKVIELGPADNQAVEFRLKKPVVTVELKGYSNRSVYINGGFVGSARPKQIEVEVGPAPIEVKYKGRVEKTIPLVLHEGYRYIVETDRIVAQDALGNSYEVDLQTGQMNVSPGTLQVTSSPDRATLFLDGESLFRYTPDTLELEPGSYLLKMVKPGYQDFEQQVRVVSATVETVHHVFQQEVEDVRVRSSYVSEWGSSREETVFRSEDDGIQFSLVLENCFDAHSIEVQWIDPDGEMYKVQTISLSGD